MSRLNLQPYKTSHGIALQKSPKSLTEYCSDIYNDATDVDPAVLDCPDEEHLLILREEVEAAVKALKTWKSAGVDIISVMIDRYINTLCCNHINFKVRPYQWALLEAFLVSCRKSSGKPILIHTPQQLARIPGVL